MTLDEIRPFGDRLIIRPDAKIETTDGGLVIPETVLADNPNYFYVTGIVLALGDGVRIDVYECNNQQCQQRSRRQVNERCQVCGATQRFVYWGERRAFDLRVGERVLFNRFAGKQIETDAREKLLILREIEVLGRIEGEHRVLPGYEAPRWDRPTSNPGDQRMVG